jgi:hypothetical protein
MLLLLDFLLLHFILSSGASAVHHESSDVGHLC